MASLSYPAAIDYMDHAGLPDMAINDVWNNRSGPGGSTRRLHQPLEWFLGAA